MKPTKGSVGYIRNKKKKSILKTVLSFGIVFAIFFLGISQTGNRLNSLTIVSILGCLPASKSLVELIMLIPHRSVDVDKIHSLKIKTNLLTKVYELVFTSEKHIMPVEYIVISDNIICGYTSKKKIDVDFFTKYLKQHLAANDISNVKVVLYKEYSEFESYVSGLNSRTTIEKTDAKRLEEKIREVLLNLSL